MTRQRLLSFYVWSVILVGFALWIGSTLIEAPAALQTTPAGLVTNALILLALTFLSTVSPMETAVGTVTVSLAPQFGAILVLPPWAVMLVAALGTIDARVPGRDIKWHGFFFNRALYTFIWAL